MIGKNLCKKLQNYRFYTTAQLMWYLPLLHHHPLGRLCFLQESLQLWNFRLQIYFLWEIKFINTSYLTYSNWNLNKIFTLKCELGQVHSAKRNISDFPPCRKLVVFVTEFVIFFKTSNWNELEENWVIILLISS